MSQSHSHFPSRNLEWRTDKHKGQRSTSASSCLRCAQVPFEFVSHYGVVLDGFGLDHIKLHNALTRLSIINF